MPPRRPFLHLRSVAVMLLVAACAAPGTPYAGPTTTPAREALETWTEELPSGRGFRIMFRNNTRDWIRITSIELYDCQNVNQACARFDPRIALAPGRTTEALEVGPALPSYGFSFNYRYSSLTGR